MEGWAISTTLEHIMSELELTPLVRSTVLNPCSGDLQKHARLEPAPPG